MKPRSAGTVERDPPDQHHTRLGSRADDDVSAVESALKALAQEPSEQVPDEAVLEMAWRIIDGKLYLVYDPTYVEDLDGPARDEILANAEAHWPETKAKIEQQGFN